MKIQEGCAHKNIDTPLFEYPLAHADDPITSFMAADEIIRLGTVDKQIKIMCELLRKYDKEEGWTWRELAKRAFKDYKFSHSEDALAYTFHRRSSIAKNRGLIVEQMKRKCNVSGFAATAWRIMHETRFICKVCKHSEPTIDDKEQPREWPLCCGKAMAMGVVIGKLER